MPECDPTEHPYNGPEEENTQLSLSQSLEVPEIMSPSAFQSYQKSSTSKKGRKMHLIREVTEIEDADEQAEEPIEGSESA